jgi:hypothetical protein
MRLLRQITRALTVAQSRHPVPAPCYSVQLIDVATGHAWRAGHLSASALSRNPAQTAADLMRNRDPRRFTTRVQIAQGDRA